MTFGNQENQDGSCRDSRSSCEWTAYYLYRKGNQENRGVQGIRRQEYVATIRFGETTPSHDRETEVDGRYPVEHINEELVIQVMNGFLGEQKQVPPVHSAKMLEGKRAYEYPQGKELKKK